MGERSFEEMLNNIDKAQDVTEDAAREEKHQKAAKRYEESLTQPLHPEEIKIDKKVAEEDKRLIEIHKPSGLKSRRTSRGWERGHRKGLKPIKHREAA